MKYVVRYLKPYYLHIIIAWSLMLIELAVELMLPFFLGKMIDQGIQTQNLDAIIYWGSIMVGLAFLSFVAGVFNSFYASHVTFRFGYDVRQKLFDKVQAFSFKNLNEYPTSSLVTRFTNDIRMIQNGIFMGLRIMLRAPLLVIGGVVMAFIVNWRIALIFLVTVPLLIGSLLWLVRKGGKLFEKVQARLDNVNRIMQENLSGIRLIKAFLRKRYETNRFKKTNTELMTYTKTSLRLIEASMPILLFVMNMSLLFILWYGNIEVGSNNAEVGDVVAIVNYALRVSMAISMFGFLTMALARMKASAERIERVLDADIDLIETKNANDQYRVKDGAIEFSNVSFHYPNYQENVLMDLSFKVKPQEKIAIIGATGSGKTSLFQLIPRLYDVTNGAVFLDGHDVRDFKLNHLRRAIGYVPQAPLLFTGSIRENIRWGKNGATEDEIIQAAKDAQIHDTINALPNGYETPIGQKGVNLSGGQKQRVSIARALIRQPRILMLDDSTSALDLKTESHLLDAIQAYQCTTLIVTQKVITAMNADRIFLLDDGKLLATGNHNELIKSSELYQKIVESQFGKEGVREL
ncbi:ABC transporter ATP-binding protein [Tenuibacillus multivorans]|uniref:ATP-binding cassette, subfamily B n=1 Tax=Tenuibacillus multivorans TaxID=237069 RepID=A0A1H0B4W2_9BACI|nr:ABC transporter ATP-binding protein [Tenuibacillus multivorans]GEL77528.1 putative ABC transporter ATP-binding protein YfiB [Tenuibacillus multivorans]SDN40642.1 ATP-binding cassette, subfamily B [Tenuibacillus multivorans]